MNKKYRNLFVGEIIKKEDEYISFHTPGVYSPVAKCSIGQRVLECNAKYYRRRVS